MKHCDQYLGWRNFTRPEHMQRDEMDWRGLERSKRIGREVRTDVERLQAMQEDQRRRGVRCPVVGGEESQP